MALKTNYVDDILNTEKNTMRKYKEVANADNTKSFMDVTEYKQIGDNFGAADVNTQNKAINNMEESIAQLNNSLANYYTKESIDYKFEWKKSEYVAKGINEYISFVSWFSKTNIKELMFIVHDGFHQYSFRFPFGLYNVIYKSDFYSDISLNFVSVKYNEWYGDKEGQFIVQKCYRDGIAVSNENLTISLYFR